MGCYASGDKQKNKQRTARSKKTWQPLQEVNQSKLFAKNSYQI